jgi:isocitrate lyase
MSKYDKQAVTDLKIEWATNPRWKGVARTYTAEDVQMLKGRVRRNFSLSLQGSTNFWTAINNRDYINALGAVTGNQAVQMVRGGLEAIYLSGWQVAGDANLSGQTYPDQSLYPVNSGPQLCSRINNALIRADQIDAIDENGTDIDWMVPIIADAEAGFGGHLNVYELTKSYIEAGAAGIHLEDQLSSEKKCGHMGGKVLIPTSQHIRSLIAARLAADVSGVPLIIIARTDARSAKLITSDVDPADHQFIQWDQPRTPEGYYKIKSGHEAAVARALAYAPFADLLWMETSTPDLEVAKQFAKEIHDIYPDKLLAYNCSPSFNWKTHMTDEQISQFQIELGKAGYKFQFVTLAGFHSLNHSMYELANGYKKYGMTAYVELQEKEKDAEKSGYTATKHQKEVGAGYFDAIATIISGGRSDTLSVKGSTEEKQF